MYNTSTFFTQNHTQKINKNNVFITYRLCTVQYISFEVQTLLNKHNWIFKNGFNTNYILCVKIDCSMYIYILCHKNLQRLKKPTKYFQSLISQIL